MAQQVSALEDLNSILGTDTVENLLQQDSLLPRMHNATHTHMYT